MVRGVEYHSYEERLRDVQPEKGKGLQGDRTAAFQGPTRKLKRDFLQGYVV